MKRAISIRGKDKSRLTNYSRPLARLALHYNRFPLDLDAEQVMDYQNVLFAGFFRVPRTKAAVNEHP